MESNKKYSMTILANAKINLYLDIVGKRDDGYHDIVTEMQEIDLADTVTVSVFAGELLRVTCDNPEIPADNRNIAYRAAELFLSESGLHSCSTAIHIKKRIPVMAGLGGSSTDGAAVLKCLNLLHGNVFSNEKLREMGAKLGADVPFFLVGGRAKCCGIGDIITPLEPIPTRFYVIIQPNFYCDTKSAYQKYGSVSVPAHSRKSGNIFQELYNDERIDNACSELMRLGAEYASMSGSGSAVFGVFDDLITAETAFQKLDYPFKHIARNVKI